MEEVDHTKQITVTRNTGAALLIPCALHRAPCHLLIDRVLLVTCQGVSHTETLLRALYEGSTTTTTYFFRSHRQPQSSLPTYPRRTVGRHKHIRSTSCSSRWVAAVGR